MNLHDLLKREGYTDLKEVDGRGLCGLMRFMFTTGLCYGLDEGGYNGRYCFDQHADAKEALAEWDGNDDPDGNWIKHKGRNEYSNPNYKRYT